MTGWIVTISLYFIFFALFSTFGFWGIRWVDRNMRRDNWLDENGREIQSLHVGTKATMGQCRVLCEWKEPTTEQLYQFMGDWNTGIEPNTIPPGTLIPVLVNIDHPQCRHRVDVSQWSP